MRRLAYERNNQAAHASIMQLVAPRTPVRLSPQRQSAAFDDIAAESGGVPSQSRQMQAQRWCHHVRCTEPELRVLTVLCMCCIVRAEQPGRQTHAARDGLQGEPVTCASLLPHAFETANNLPALLSEYGPCHSPTGMRATPLPVPVTDACIAASCYRSVGSDAATTALPISSVGGCHITALTVLL